MVKEKAIAYWTEVNEKYPYKGVERWIEEIKSGRADWFRNKMLLHEAVAHNSKKYGMFLCSLFEENFEEAKLILEKYNLDLQ